MRGLVVRQRYDPAPNRSTTDRLINSIAREKEERKERKDERIGGETTPANEKVAHGMDVVDASILGVVSCSAVRERAGEERERGATHPASWFGEPV